MSNDLIREIAVGVEAFESLGDVYGTESWGDGTEFISMPAREWMDEDYIRVFSQ